MCGTALTLIGAGLSAYSSYVGAQQQASNLSAQAAMDERNARIERDRAAFDADRHSREARRIFGRQRAAYLASGVSLAGSPSMVIEDSAREAELDRLAILYGGEVNARNFEDRARVNRTNARTTRQGALLGAAAPLISGFGRTLLRSSY